jgi:hypothetical protein
LDDDDDDDDGDDDDDDDDDVDEWRTENKMGENCIKTSE